jgi:hypothetical protein
MVLIQLDCECVWANKCDRCYEVAIAMHTIGIRMLTELVYRSAGQHQHVLTSVSIHVHRWS